MIPMPRLSFDDAVRTLPAAGATAAVGSVSLVALKLWRTPHVQDAVAIVFAAVLVFAQAHAFLDSHRFAVRASGLVGDREGVGHGVL